MRVVAARVTESREVYTNTFVLWLSAPEVSRGAKVGQFVMVRCGEGADPLLPRALSIYRLRDTPEGRELGLLYEVVGRGTQWLSRRHTGDTVELYGPLGHGYRITPRSQNLLLVAGGIGVAPLVWMADDATAAGRNVTLLMGARCADYVFPAEMLPAEVELVIATDDGSAGHHGFVTDLLPQYAAWSDQILGCGPTPMFRSMATKLRSLQYRKSCQVLLEERMACGTGICYSCAVETRRRGMKLICKDGPAFELRDIY
ncbi:MAG: dihydroorotate dehydrogenase electron transfer subunit [Chloroflexi bacterium]|nr:dihydroorotate dehydrogenase electron transfer subunit [Chloroflexota bacterium]